MTDMNTYCMAVICSDFPILSIEIDWCPMKRNRKYSNRQVPVERNGQNLSLFTSYISFKNS